METQLVFTEIEETAKKQQLEKMRKPLSSVHSRKRAIKGENPWWKLSAEEKAIGKQGIAQIREILDKYPSDMVHSLKKAS